MYQKHPCQQHASLSTVDYNFSNRLGRRHLTCSRSHDRRPEETIDIYIFLPAPQHIDGSSTAGDCNNYREPFIVRLILFIIRSNDRILSYSAV